MQGVSCFSFGGVRAKITKNYIQCKNNRRKSDVLLPFFLLSHLIFQERQPLNDFFATCKAIQLLVLGLHDVRNLPLVL